MLAHEPEEVSMIEVDCYRPVDTPIAMVKTTIMKVAIHPKGKNPYYDDGVLYLELVDEGAGAFLELSQGENKVAIDPEEVEVIAAAAKQLMQGVGE